MVKGNLARRVASGVFAMKMCLLEKGFERRRKQEM